MTFSCSFLCGVDMVCEFVGLPSTNRVLQAKFSWRPWRAAAAAERHQFTSATHTYAQPMPHAKRLPDAARSLGKSMRIFKSEIHELHADEADAVVAPASQASTVVQPEPAQPAISMERRG
jgi:hypothetical protein